MSKRVLLSRQRTETTVNKSVFEKEDEGAIYVRTYGVLVWVHIDSEAVLLAFEKHTNDIVHEPIIVFFTR